MSKADELRAKAARVASRTAAQSTSSAVPAPAALATPEHVPVVAAPLTKSVRSTVDLAPEQHRGLQAWINEAATELGRARLSKQEVMVALVRRLLVDKDLASTVKRDLRAASQG